KYPVNRQKTIRAGRPLQAPAVISHTRPRPILRSFDQARSHRVEVNVFHLLVILLYRPHRPVEKPWLPQKARLSSASIDAMRRAHLDRFHNSRDGERKAWE